MNELVTPYFSTPVFVALFLIALIIGISLGWYLHKAFLARRGRHIGGTALGVQPVLFTK